jgi:GT2 family glycosyltransferase
VTETATDTAPARTAPEASGPPDVSVVVPSHQRTRRLAALLDALAAQTLDPERFEIVVVHDDGPGPTADLLRTHPLARSGRLHVHAVEPNTGSAARMRNIGWRAARAPLIASTDDDCRPDPAWLENLLAVAHANPGAIVQGRVRPDPDEWHHFREHLLLHTIVAEPPTRFGQTCNILYPRALFDALGGFSEHGFDGCEDVDLLWRAVEHGATQVGAPNALVHHAIEPVTLAWRVREAPRRYGNLARAAARHPGFRRAPGHPLGRFLRPTHAWLLPALAGVAGAIRHRPLILLALPWLFLHVQQIRGYAGPPRWPERLAARAAVDIADVAALAATSARERSFFL